MEKSTPTNERSKSASPRTDTDTDTSGKNPIPVNLTPGIGNPTHTFPLAVSFKARLSAVILILLTSFSLFFKDDPKPDPKQTFQVLTPAQLKGLESQFQNASKESSLRLWDWIHARTDQAGAFSEEALSWRGKWRSVQPWLPWGDKNADRDFLQSIFHKHFFKPSELEEAIRNEWINTQMRWDELENLFLIQEGNLNHALIGDRHNFAPNPAAQNVGAPFSDSPPIGDRHNFTPNPAAQNVGAPFSDSSPIGDRHNFTPNPATQNVGGPFRDRNPELDRIQEENHKQTIEGVGQVVVAEVTSEILARALTRLAISMGILSTGASSSAYTFGAGAILGLIIDQCYSWIQKPEQKLELELKLALELLADEVTKAHLEMLNEQIQIRLNQWNPDITNY